MSSEWLFLRIGAICLVAGSVAAFAFRAAHGDLPAADPAAALTFIAAHANYAAVHLGAILGVLTWVGGLVSLVQLWSVALRLVMWRRADTAAGVAAS
jgi:hypothetical protein